MFVVCAVTQATVDPATVTELAAKGNDVTAIEHSNDEVHSLEKTVPGIHVKVGLKTRIFIFM